MKIMIRGMNIDLTPSVKEYVEEKIGSITHMLDKKHEALAEARVEVGKPSAHHHSGKIYYAEVNLKIGGELYRATSNHDDLHAAVQLRIRSPGP